MKYKGITQTKRGGTEVLELMEYELTEPKAKEVRIKILSSGVGSTDIFIRNNLDFYVPKMPFVAGCEIVGVVDSIGSGVSLFKAGDTVAAMTAYGGYGEYIYVGEEHLVKVPANVDLTKAVALIINYTAAYQMLHRYAKVKEGDKVLVIGANGSVGSAVVELCKIAKLKIYGLTSKHKAEELSKQGVIPIDYSNSDFVEEIKKAEPNGIDYVFDGVAGNYIFRGSKVLRKGGKLISFGNPGFYKAFLGLLRIILLTILPNRISATIYGIFYIYYSKKNGRNTVKEDLATLLKMLEEGKINPVISTKLPILEAKKANELLESGKAKGKIVLLSPELIN